MMKAVLCREFGPPRNLSFEDIEAPECGPQQIAIDVRSVGLNFPDLLQIQGKYQHQPLFPFIPGSECAGIVRQVGPEVTRWRSGDSVMVMTTNGAMAERVVVDADAVEPIPDGMSFHEASAFGIAYGTSYHALQQRAGLRQGETLVVLGAAGGVGLAAVQIGKALGAKVIAGASTREKLEVARRHGADVLIDYSDGRLKEKLKEILPRGADVVFDPVGGDLFEQAARSIAWNGRILVIGFASGTIPKYPVNLALLKGCSLVGVFWGAFRKNEPLMYVENCAKLSELYRQGHVKPLVSEVFPWEDYAQALETFMERKAVGKIVLRIGSSAQTP